jgi:tRNA(Ser,Leu) C12 N-acetylase TAN1
MKDWNVVVSVCEGHFPQACKLLEQYGLVEKTDFFNVLVMKVDDLRALLDALRKRMVEDPESLSCVSRLVPVTHTFTFQSPEEFEAKAKETVLTWVPELAGRSFHVRMRRRGFKGRLSSAEEERFLDDILLAALEKAGTIGRVSFEKPDVVIALETVGPKAGLSLWERLDMERYLFLRLD